MEATSYYNIKAHKDAKHFLGLGSNKSASDLAMHMIHYQFCVFWTELGQMTLTFGVGISRSFEACPKLSSFDINLLPGLGLLFTAKNYQN